MKHNKNKKGFTIVELVIVIGVIGILAGILIPTFVNVTKSAEEAAAKSEVANAFSAYVADAADGEVDDVKAVTGHDAVEGKTYTIELIKQSEALLVRGDKNYIYSADKGWEVTTTVNKDETNLLVVVKPENTKELPTYNNVKVYKRVLGA